MMQGWHVALIAFGYVTALFALAWFGDRYSRKGKVSSGRPLIYALSIAVYCTSWTFFGSVGLAATTGYDFMPVYVGPILVFLFGRRLIQRIVRLAKSQNITSVADFLAARYGKSPSVAAIVTLVSVAGSLPYIALQLKAIAVSVEVLLAPTSLQAFAPLPGLQLDTAFVVAAALALFAILFGTRHIDATEHQDGLMLAIAADSLVKLMAFLAVGLFVVFSVFGGAGDFFTRLQEHPQLRTLFGQSANGGVWLTVTLLAAVCVLLLPRQFHVTVVENRNEEEIRRSTWLFPLYLILINIFVVPIAAAGLLLVPHSPAGPDMFVLSVPIAGHTSTITILAFIGGLSAATAMVIVDSIALAIMISNGLIMPWLVGRPFLARAGDSGLADWLLFIRRVAIFVILLLGYLVYRALGQVHGLAAIGLLSFAAIAQLAPAFFGGLIWRRATARGAIAGLAAGFALWIYTLLLPWIVKAGWLPMSLLQDGPFGMGFLNPEALFYLRFDPLTHGVLWSLSANTFTYISVSLLRLPEPIERLQAHIFVLDDDLPRPSSTPAFRLWRTTVTVGDVQQAVGRYLGPERAERSFQEFATGRSVVLQPHAEADVGVLRFTEHLLASAIGAASARLVLSLLLKRGNVSSQSALKLLDDASEAIQYNRDLLHSALDQVRHGLSVFDKDMKLICWNRQFREMLSLPPELGRVGVPLDQILRTCAERGDFGPGPVDELIHKHLLKLAVTKEAFQQRLGNTDRTIEIRIAPMPQGGIVATYSDITERVAAAEALERANETLERRVMERTAELTSVNLALGIAKSKADEANQDKTRFLAAASHDILQPLNAARLYASSLIEREPAQLQIARNIDASLEAVEEILGALLDISRLDAGHLEPELAPVNLAELFDQLRVEFEPMAREEQLELRIVPTKAWVLSDRRLLRRVLQNLLSNALKYTRSGGILLGCRRRGGGLVIQVSDTGPGIPRAKQAVIFKEFHRLEETAATIRGLGLGLSIVERICKVLDAQIGLVSVPGRGSTFWLPLQRTEPKISTPPMPPVRSFAADVAGAVILCIDNERQVLAGMGTLLAGWGCRVLLATSTREAIEVISPGDAGRLVPDVILADYHLDEGAGIEAVLAVRQATGRDIPAVIITADRTERVERDIRRHGHRLLRKPIKAGALRALLAQAVLHRTAAE